MLRHSFLQRIQVLLSPQTNTPGPSLRALAGAYFPLENGNGKTCLHAMHAKLSIDFYQLLSFPYTGPTFLMNCRMLSAPHRQDNTCETLMSFTLGCELLSL